jgi:3-hydroxy-9,10-secoandrosta-1,3,5(10)-triene-9,17-dione monooxygenase reductase component
MTGEGIAAALRQITTGVYVLVVRGADERLYGSTVSWVMPLSFEPPLVGVVLQRDSETVARVRATQAFTLSLLDGTAGRAKSDVIKLGRASSEVPNKTAGVAFGESAGGLPIIARATGWLECHLATEQPVGDHILVIARVVDGKAGEGVSPPEWSYWGG